MNTNYKLAALVACVVAASLLAACGSASSSSSSSSGSASGAAASTGTRTAIRAKLVACLKQHGVTLPSRPAGSKPPGSATNGSGGAPPVGGFAGGGGFFGGGGGGFRGRFHNNPKLQAAFKACGADFGGARRQFNPAQRKTEINNFVRCVRQHGYNLPTPNLSGSGAVFPRSIESNKKFETAARSCASILRPPGGPSPSGQSTTASSTA